MFDGVLTRSGVFIYRDADGGERREYRPPEEVFKADALDSFALVPLTDNHPPELVTAENSREYARGAVGRPRRDGSQVVSEIAVHDAELVAKIDAGKREISCGYLAEVVDEPGVTPDGERYDAIQRGIEGNHVAIVDVARAGPEARLRMDGAPGAAVQVSDATARVERKDTGRMRTIKIDGVEYEVSEQVAQAVEKLRSAHADAVKAEKARADGAETKATEAEARAVNAEKALEAEQKARKDAEDPAKIAERVRARAELESAARKVLGEESKFDGQSDHEVRVAVIEKVDGDMKSELESVPETQREVYVRGRFDGAVGRADRADKELDQLRPLATPRDDGGESPGEKARQKMIERNRTAPEAKA